MRRCGRDVLPVVEEHIILHRISCVGHNIFVGVRSGRRTDGMTAGVRCGWLGISILTRNEGGEV